MRSFWQGVFSTLVAGILLFVAQDRYSDWKKHNQLSISIRTEDDIASFSGDQFENLAKIAGTDVRLATFDIKNVGADPLVSAKLHLDSEVANDIKVLATGSSPKSDKNLSPLKIQKSDHGAEVVLPLMESGEEQRFWIIYECCKIFKFSSEVPGLKLTQSVSDYDNDSSDDFLWWIEAVGALLVTFVFGAVADYKITKASLRKRGHDLDALVKLPEIPVPSPKVDVHD